MGARKELGDVLAGVALVALAWYVVATASGFRGDGWVVPVVISWLIGAGGLWLALRGVAAMVLLRRGRAAAGEGEPVHPLYALILLALTVGYVLLVPRLGFYLASLVFMPLVLAVLGLRRPWLYALTTAGFLVFVHVVFERVFFIPMPRAAWF